MNSDLRSLAASLGGDVVSGQILAPGPGHSPRDRSMAVRMTADGFLVHSYAGDSFRDCMDHVRARLGLGTVRTARARSASDNSEPEREGRDGKVYRLPVRTIDAGTERARKIWAEAKPAAGTVVERYLQSRGLKLPAGDILRFHEACPWERGRVPAMVAAFRSIANSRVITGIHRTALASSGEKIGRKMLGRARDAVIMLDPDECVTTGLTIAEGIESGLAGRELGWRPCWALGSAGAIARFPVLSGIECINILAETDDSGANARAVQELGACWLKAGREVLTITPRFGGDANDALRRLA